MDTIIPTFPLESGEDLYHNVTRTLQGTAQVGAFKLVSIDCAFSRFCDSTSQVKVKMYAARLSSSLAKQKLPCIVPAEFMPDKTTQIVNGFVQILPEKRKNEAIMTKSKRITRMPATPIQEDISAHSEKEFVDHDGVCHPLIGMLALRTNFVKRDAEIVLPNNEVGAEQGPDTSSLGRVMMQDVTVATTSSTMDGKESCKELWSWIDNQNFFKSVATGGSEISVLSLVDGGRKGFAGLSKRRLCSMINIKIFDRR